jgi:hypothetical protein
VVIAPSALTAGARCVFEGSKDPRPIYFRKYPPIIPYVSTCSHPFSGQRVIRALNYQVVFWLSKFLQSLVVTLIDNNDVNQKSRNHG